MDSIDDACLHRTPSQNSTSSSRKSSTVRVRPRKYASSASLQITTAPSDKSLTSFPSLSPSPDSSPIAPLVDKPATPPVDLSAQTAEPDAQATVRKIPRSAQSIVGSLIASSPSPRNRSALFDDTLRDACDVPGNLHKATDEHIEHVMARVGAVNLARQLAADLAQRDAQMTVLRRKAEERERILKKMLQECEVSNLDIETRLRGLDRVVSKRNETDFDTIKISKSMKATGSSFPEDSLDKRLAAALEDETGDYVEPVKTPDTASLLGYTSQTDEDSKSSKSPRSQGKTMTRGWKGYLWNGGQMTRKGSRAPSVANGRENRTALEETNVPNASQPLRKALTSDFFTPPPTTSYGTSAALPSLRRLQSQDKSVSEPSSRRSSVSVTSWALRLVAGSSQVNRDGDKQGTIRGRPSALTSIVGNDVRSSSIDSTMTTRSTSASINGVSRGQGRPPKRSLALNGPMKGIPPENLRNTTTSLGQESPPALSHSGGNYGPVEMDMILPEHSRPPTLIQHHNTMSDSSEYLTDRFGFIYDQRRRKRQHEASAALLKYTNQEGHLGSLGDGRDSLHNGEGVGSVSPPGFESDSQSISRPGSTFSPDDLTELKNPKRWQDYLHLATFPTELLSHTPSVAPITSIEAPEEISTKTPQVIVHKRGSLPVTSNNPQPSASRIVSNNAEFIHTSPSGPATLTSPVPAQTDPVKVLLEQLTELHDSLQRDKTVRWNEFLRKIRAERKRVGEAAASSTNPDRLKALTMPEAHLTDGEVIGIAGMGNKGKVGQAKWKEFRRLVLGGIPVAYRAKIWAECSGASTMRIPSYYDGLVSAGADDPSIISQIQMDITRTLTDNIFFRRGPGVSKLNEVLIAYSRRNSEVGYCQGMNLITACLLLIMPTAEDAFWMLVTMVENILPSSYYDHSLLASRADQFVLRQYVADLLPRLSAHLDELSIELEALTFQWFLSVFTDCLSAEALFRVWDVVLCMRDGSTFLFQVALALLKLNERELISCQSPAGVYHYINHQMTNHAISIDGLIQASDALKKVVKKSDVEERRAIAIERERELIRQREQLRLERARKRAERETGVVEGSNLGEGSSQEAPRQSPASTLAESMASSTMPRSGEVDNGEVDQHIPTPIDEEASWRA